MTTVTPLRRLYLFVFFLLCCSLQAQQPARYTNNGTGREFWIAIPPNEHDNGYPSLELEIYVSSAFDTRVTLEHPGSGFRVTKPVKAGRTTTFTTADETASWSWEIRDDEKASSQGIRLTADRPIAVSVLNSKPVSAEGYTAIPVDRWGTDYRHLSLYDFGEFENTPWSGGFVVIAKENNTTLQYTLQGVDNGNPAGRTRLGKRLGQTVSVTLQRGQTYMIRGNGQTLNEFDFSGTRVVADKPVGLISFHQRTMIPSSPSPNNGRDHIVEMLPPVSTWGTKHVSLEINKGKNRGDFFRIVAAEDDTRFLCRYTDLANGETYAWEGRLAKAGDFVERENSWPPTTSIRGVAVWTSSKPTLVMQYSYSMEWDQSELWDPFMMRIVPTSQFTQHALIHTPSNVEFVNNYINLIAVGDTADPLQTQLKSIMLNGTPVYELDTNFLSNRIQATPYYWARLKVFPGVHTLTGAAPFSANLYGYSSFSQYGWTAAELFNKLTGLDTVPPVLSLTGSCGTYTAVVREQQGSAGELDDSVQTDSGISRIDLDYGQSSNMNIVYETDTSAMHIEPRREEFTVRLEVADRSMPAFGVVYAVDRAGNVAVDSVRYTPSAATIEPAAHSFGIVRVGKTRSTTATVSNPLSTPVVITDIFLKQAASFSLRPSAPLPFTLPPQGALQVEIEYHPEQETSAEERDTLVAVLECGDLTVGEVRGSAAVPSLSVFRNFFLSTSIGTERCKSFELANNGPFPIVVTTIATTSDIFYIDGPTPALPLTLAPGEWVNLESLCFIPKNDGAYTDYLIVSWTVDNEPPVLDSGVVEGTGITTTGILLPDERIPALESAPNPASGLLTLRYALPLAGVVRAELFAATGRIVRVLYDGYQEAGPQALDISIDGLPAGVYLCRLATPSGVAVCKITVVE